MFLERTDLLQKISSCFRPTSNWINGQSGSPSFLLLAGLCLAWQALSRYVLFRRPALPIYLLLQRIRELSRLSQIYFSSYSFRTAGTTLSRVLLGLSTTLPLWRMMQDQTFEYDSLYSLLAALEIAETTYISPFRLTTPDPLIADFQPLHLPDSLLRPCISRPCTLNRNAASRHVHDLSISC